MNGDSVKLYRQKCYLCQQIPLQTYSIMKKLLTILLLVVFGLLLSALPVRAQQRFTVIQDTFLIVFNIKYITIWHIILKIWFLRAVA